MVSIDRYQMVEIVVSIDRLLVVIKYREEFVQRTKFPERERLATTRWTYIHKLLQGVGSTTIQYFQPGLSEKRSSTMQTLYYNKK